MSWIGGMMLGQPRCIWRRTKGTTRLSLPCCKRPPIQMCVIRKIEPPTPLRCVQTMRVVPVSLNSMVGATCNSNRHHKYCNNNTTKSLQQCRPTHNHHTLGYNIWMSPRDTRTGTILPRVSLRGNCPLLPPLLFVRPLLLPILPLRPPPFDAPRRLPPWVPKCGTMDHPFDTQRHTAVQVHPRGATIDRAIRHPPLEGPSPEVAITTNKARSPQQEAVRCQTAAMMKCEWPHRGKPFKCQQRPQPHHGEIMHHVPTHHHVLGHRSPIDHQRVHLLLHLVARGW
jgi:hypothetical protein